LFSGLAALSALPLVQAQESAPVPIHWNAALPAGTHSLQPGQKITVALTADIDSGWHVYAFPQPPDSPVIATDITVPDGQALALSGEIKPPKAESQMDPTVGKETTLYKNSVTFDLPLKVARKAQGKQNLEVDIRYQACNNRMCLPPRTDKVTVPVDISSSHR
jgi:DsbC/DsbD-like thiol-disulfide interchange protein